MVVSRNSLSPSHTVCRTLLAQPGLEQPHGESALPGPPLELKPARRGFTLTELLVVITIIAVLASLTSVAVMRALDTAKQTKIKVEVDALDLAFKAYKEKYGSYPPCDFSSLNKTNVIAHLARAFPRCDVTQTYKDLVKYVDNQNARPDQALVLWLNGFNPDVTQPFFNLATLTKAQRTPPFFDFDQSRLVKYQGASSIPLASICPSYVPAGIKTGAPYLYMDATWYARDDYANFRTLDPRNVSGTLNLAGVGFAAIYINDVNGDGVFTLDTDVWVNPDSFIIISTGMDGLYGSTVTFNPSVATTKRLYPTGVGYDTSTNLADDDNITNFCPKARLADAKP